MSLSTPRLSDLFRRSTSRRAFLGRASALAATLPATGALLDACTGAASKGAPQQGGAGTSEASQGPTAARISGENADSRLDTSLKAGRLNNSAVTPGALKAPAPPPLTWYDPTLPPPAPGRRRTVHMTVREIPISIDDSTVVAGWTFDGNIPGPIVHIRQGDTVEFTLTNQGSIPHSMDFHATRIDPKTAFRSALPGQSVSYTFQPHYAGAFLYHCGTAPVLMHIGSGMCGAIVVDPATALPPAHEFVLVQNEYYLGQPVNGVSPFDYQKMLGMLPDFVAFNGRPDQYQSQPLRVPLGARVRFYVVAAGPNHPCAFHIVGEQFDAVYLGTPPGNAIHGVQTFGVAAGGGMIFEFVADVSGTFPFVNHAFGHGQKGAIGLLVVEG
jgi:nitrite reductase (NO-forming)